MTKSIHWLAGLLTVKNSDPIKNNINRISVVTALLCYLAGTLFFFLLNSYAILIAAWLEGTLFLLIAGLFKRRPEASTLLAILLHNAAVIYFGLLLGVAANAELLVIFLIGLSVMGFDTRSAAQIGCTTASCVTMIILECNHHVQLLHLLTIPKHLTLLISILSNTVIMALNFFMLYTFKDALLKRNAELKRISDDKDMYVREVAHEMGNPVNGAKDMLDLILENRTLDKRLVKMLKRVQAALSAAKVVMSNTISHARYDNKQETKILPRQFHLYLWMKELTELYSYRKEKVSIITTIEPDVSKYISTDRYLLGQIVTNILINALNFSNDGKSVFINITKADNKLCIAVSDQGRGIAQDKIDAIFKEFVTSRTINNNGSGLGLFISHKLAKMLGGDISVESVPDAGTTFYITVPVGMSDTPEIRFPEIIPFLKPQLHFEQEILLIEDDDMMQCLTEQRIKNAGFRVLVAKTFADALEFFKERNFAAVVTDLGLSDLAGELLIREIKQITNAPVIILSGNALTAEETVSFFNLGVSHIINKMAPHEMVDILEKVIGEAEIKH
jgi:two-component system, sensor histidine kinase